MKVRLVERILSLVEPAPFYPPRAGRWRNWKAFRRGMVLGILALAAMWPAVHAGDMGAGDTLIIENPLVSTVGGLARNWTADHAGPVYRPVAMSALWFEYRLAEGQLSWIRAGSALVHACNVILVWMILRRLNVRGAFLAAAVFAIHPLHVQAIAWASQQPMVLGVFFSLLTIWSYLKLVEVRPPATAECVTPPLEEPALAQRLAPILFALAAGLCEPSLIVAPILAAILCRRRSPMRNDRKVLVGMLTMAGIIGAADIMLARSASALIRTLVDFPLYFVRTFWLVGLARAYPHWYVNHFAAGRYGLLAWADGYLFSVAIIAGATAMLVKYLDRRRWMQLLLSAATIAGLGVLSWRAAGIYQGEEAVWRHVADNQPSSTVAHDSLGAVLLAAGKNDEAAGHFKTALAIDSTDVDAMLLLGRIEESRGHLPEAQELYESARNHQPTRPQIALLLAGINARRGDESTARQLASQAIASAPKDETLRNDFGILLADLGHGAEAIVQYRNALELNPYFTPALVNMSNIYFSQNQFDEAAEAIQQAAKIDPKNYAAFRNAGVMLYRLKAYDRAERMFRAVLRLRPNDIEGQLSLGVCLAAQNRMDEAIYSFDRVLASRPNDAVVLHLRETARLQKDRSTSQ